MKRQYQKGKMQYKTAGRAGGIFSSSFTIWHQEWKFYKGGGGVKRIEDTSIIWLTLLGFIICCTQMIQRATFPLKYHCFRWIIHAYIGKSWFLGGKRGIKIYVLGELKSPGIKSHTHTQIFLPHSYLHTQEQMCASLQWVFLNTNKEAARQGHGPKLKSHFPASDTAISTPTLTLAPQLWWNSHYGLGKEIVPGWEVNYVAWHKNVEKANSTWFSLGKRFFFCCSNISMLSSHYPRAQFISFSG